MSSPQLENSLNLDKNFSLNRKKLEDQILELEKDENVESNQSLSQMYFRNSTNPEGLQLLPKKEKVDQDFKYKPRWFFITFLIVMLSIQSLHSGYAMGTYNRIGDIISTQFNWTPGQQQTYEGLISALLVLGITFGRLFGAKFINKGRKLCLLTSVFVGFVGIGLMMPLNIYIFLLGRFVYGVSAGLFSAVGPRYVEECSPQQYLSLFFTLYTFGISLNKPFVMMADLLIPSDKSVFPTTNAWRYFILLPVAFGLFCLLGTLFVVRYDTPMYLITQRRYTEAK